MSFQTNVLYWGDNLSILRNREHFPDECVDLIYLDPPFNSNASYNVLFKEPTGELSTAQLRRQHGASLEGVSDFLGHRDIATTARYLARMVGERDTGWQGAAASLGTA